MPRIYGKNLTAFELATSGKLSVAVQDTRALEVDRDNPTSTVSISTVANDSLRLSLTNSNLGMLRIGNNSNVVLQGGRDASVVAGSNANITAGNAINLNGSNLTMNISSNINLASASNLTISASNVLTAIGGSQVALQSGSNIIAAACNDITMIATSNMTGRASNITFGGNNSVRILTGVGTTSTQTYPSWSLTGETTNITGRPYGNGIYELIASSSTNSSQHHAFDQSDETGWTSASRYNASGAYTGSVTTVISGVTTLGEYIQIKLPVAITATSFRIAIKYRTMSWVLAGSMDGNTWTFLNSANMFRGIETRTINNPQPCQYFRLVYPSTQYNTTSLSALHLNVDTIVSPAYVNLSSTGANELYAACNILVSAGNNLNLSANAIDAQATSNVAVRSTNNINLSAGNALTLTGGSQATIASGSNYVTVAPTSIISVAPLYQHYVGSSALSLPAIEITDSNLRLRRSAHDIFLSPSDSAAAVSIFRSSGSNVMYIRGRMDIDGEINTISQTRLNVSDKEITLAYPEAGTPLSDGSANNQAGILVYGQPAAPAFTDAPVETDPVDETARYYEKSLKWNHGTSGIDVLAEEGGVNFSAGVVNESFWELRGGHLQMSVPKKIEQGVVRSITYGFRINARGEFELFKRSWDNGAYKLRRMARWGNKVLL